MINKKISFDLPLPWKQGRFETDQIGTVNFLVGPNGSGKSKFAQALQSHLGREARILTTDRLVCMEQTRPLQGLTSDPSAYGFPVGQFENYKGAGLGGSGIDAFIVLEERMDLRVKIEATLSHLFNRRMTLEWDSGNLVPLAALGEDGARYRLDRDECHGIKELLILLTHLYNNEYRYLIVDEPEMNLHPQYQAFFMQEVRKIAGDPSAEEHKKAIFLITHSPFILDFRSIEDIKSVICFNLDYSSPVNMRGMDPVDSGMLSPTLNAHHKQLFFSDNPVFVEGNLDAQLVEAIQQARGVSVAGAGSCIIDAGGCEEVNRYLRMCLALGKKAYFLYDLDSLFSGNLRACLKEDGTVMSFLAAAGVGNDLVKYCGELENKLTGAIKRLVALNSVPSELRSLLAFLQGPQEPRQKGQTAKARVAVLTALSLSREAVASALSEPEVREIEGRLQLVVAALRQENVILLPGGALERYLPSFKGNIYEPSQDAKQKAVAAEIREMSHIKNPGDLPSRYGDLFKAVSALPSKEYVDIECILRRYLCQYILELQQAIVGNPTWQRDQVHAHLNIVQPRASKIFSVQKLDRYNHNEFSALVLIEKIVDQGQRRVRVSNHTNAGMGDFKIEQA